MILNAIRKIKNHTCRSHSKLSEIAFFPNIFLIIELIVMSKNLPPSSAGIGSKLNTQRLILIIAQIITINIIPLVIDFVIKSTIPIGPETWSIASCLSVGV